MKRRLVFICLTLVSLAVLVGAFHAAILSSVGARLVRSETPQHADIALVLGGDFSGNRILKAAELVRQGYAPRVLVSSPEGIYGHHESDFAIPFAVNAGYPESYFVPFDHQAHSTMEEAQATVPELRRLGTRKVLLVTSDYHTRRAGKIFRAAAPDLTFFVVEAPDFYFTPQGWWLTREGRKTFATEWMKTVAEWINL